ncbi:N-formylglutamate amidohydrolase [Coralliovum pocilloporae]|uniref:N-formylglutamate amidohydrolase n=1 Tax=Coralliovum pocilloporae TaxID=3066369 RepID=UPI00330782FF
MVFAAADQQGADLSAVSLINGGGTSPVLIVCEHASNAIPESFSGLGLTDDVRQSHIAWDPGADAVAAELSRLMDSTYVRGEVSRLVYDCNRPPEAHDAMPARSEIFDVPGNQNLTEEDKARRVASVYRPFEACLSEAAKRAGALVTIHSFTPIYHGQQRAVQLGILHDDDSRLADLMLDDASAHTDLEVRRNDPYGPLSGVTHTLKEHGLANGIPNVMIEVRNDLITTPGDCAAMADCLHRMLIPALDQLGIETNGGEKSA